MSTQRRLRVLHVGKFYPPYMGGIETHVQALCRELQSRVDVEVLVANDGPETVTDYDGEVRVTRVGQRLNLAGAPLCPGMARHIQDARADIVHIHLPNPAAILSLLASGYRGPLVTSYHSDIIRQRMLGFLFSPVLHYALSRSAAILAATPNHIASSPILQEHANRCRVVPYGISTESLEQVEPDEVARLRERFGPRIVLGVGRLVYYKGFGSLIQAVARVRAHLVLIGGGPLRSELEAEAARLGIQDRVSLIGHAPNLAPYYHAADVFVLPSVARSEAFGLVQLEAMASGKPVINTALDSGVPFVSLDGVTGRTVPPGDVAALADAISVILDDPELRRAYGAAARARVQEEFSLRAMTDRTLATYADVVAEHSPEGRAFATGTLAPSGGGTVDSPVW